MDKQGNVYATDWWNRRVLESSLAGEPLAQWGSLGGGPAQFWQPIGVAVDGQGNVYVTDSGNDRIQKLNVAGQP